VIVKGDSLVGFWVEEVKPGCIQSVAIFIIYAMEVQGCDDLISHILVAAVGNWFISRTSFSVTVKCACKLEEVILTNYCKKLYRIVLTVLCDVSDSYRQLLHLLEIKQLTFKNMS
jgi:hypothetical protein